MPKRLRRSSTPWSAEASIWFDQLRSYAGQNHSRIVPAKTGDYPSTSPYAKQDEEPGQYQKHDRYSLRLFSCSRDFVEIVYHLQGKVERVDEPRAVSESAVPDD